MTRERRILDAAAEAFYEKGFHGVGVDELGVRAGLSGPSIYRHFSGKDEILATVLNEAMDELMRAVEPDQGGFDQALRHHIRFAVEHRELVLIYQREVDAMVDPWRKAFRRRQVEYATRWEGLVQHRFPALEDGVTSTVTRACLGTVFAISAWPASALASPEVPATIEAVVLRGLSAWA